MHFLYVFLPLALTSSAAALVASSGCQLQLINPIPRGDTCGSPGSYQHGSPCGTSHETSMENCRAKCWGNKICLSYSYDSSSKKCTQYKKKASAQGYKHKQCSTKFWDKCCWENHCPTCPRGETKCSGMCTDTKTDTSNCGTCGNACAFTASCNLGICTCPAVRPDVCSGWCVNKLYDPQHCGTCDNDCTTGSKDSCLAGVCSCSPYKPDYCDSVCTSVLRDEKNCGTCGNDCTTGPKVNCEQGVCVCPGNNPDFCDPFCTSLQSDDQNCGECGNDCTRSGRTCEAGVCTCPTDRPNFCGTICTNYQTDKYNCGGCGNGCQDSGVGNVYCSAGECACSAPYTYIDIYGGCYD